MIFSGREKELVRETSTTWTHEREEEGAKVRRHWRLCELWEEVSEASTTRQRGYDSSLRNEAKQNETKRAETRHLVAKNANEGRGEGGWYEMQGNGTNWERECDRLNGTRHIVSKVLYE